MSDAETAFDTLTGTQLSAITFVMDYVQCDFVKAKLTAYTPPIVRSDGQTWTRADPGWRDALCERIGVVVRFVVNAGEELRVTFADDSEIAISLRDEDYVGPEAFTFSADDHVTVVG
jgi:hypothetical protein